MGGECFFSGGGGGRVTLMSKVGLLVMKLCGFFCFDAKHCFNTEDADKMSSSHF